MTINTTPTIPTALDQRAEVFCEKFADRIAPIQHYVGAVYGGTFTDLLPEQKLATLTVVNHAVLYGSFERPFKHRRAALEGMRLALSMLTNLATPNDHRPVIAKLVGDMAKVVADTFDQDSEV